MFHILFYLILLLTGMDKLCDKLNSPKFSERETAQKILSKRAQSSWFTIVALETYPIKSAEQRSRINRILNEYWQLNPKDASKLPTLDSFHAKYLLPPIEFAQDKIPEKVQLWRQFKLAIQYAPDIPYKGSNEWMSYRKGTFVLVYDMYELRIPKDVVNILMLWGLEREKVYVEMRRTQNGYKRMPQLPWVWPYVPDKNK